MIIERIDRLSFHILFTPDEITQLEGICKKENKEPDVFMHWLIRAGQEIYKLTLK